MEVASTPLGDGVYAFHDGRNVELYTHEGGATTNTVWMSPEVLSEFLAFIHSLGKQDICGFCGLPGADKAPHQIRWPDEKSAGTEFVHADCEDAECKRASDLCTGKG